MIDFVNISKSYGAREILRDVSLRINSGERAGIVGPNGAGKSTLFGIITGEIYAEKGTVLMPKDMRMGYLRQNLSDYGLEKILVDFVSDSLPELSQIHSRIEEIESGLQSSEDKEKLLNELGELQVKYEALGGYMMRSRAEAALCGLGFKACDLKRPLGSFSGGWQMRACLAKTLIADPALLMLDEPSNYLDIPAIEWLRKFLSAFQGTLLLISHDRFLLKSLTNVTVEINGAIVTRYQGDYDYYIREREEKIRVLEAAKKNQDKKREQLERGIERFRAKNTKAAQVQNWIRVIDKMENINVPHDLHYSGSIMIPPAPHSGVEMLRLEKVGHSYDGSNWIMTDVDLNIERGEKIGLVGYNGTGKTTLLKILAGRMQPSAGTRILGHKVITGYQAQEFAEILPPDSTAMDIVKGAAPQGTEMKKIRGVLGAFGFSGENAEKTCSVLSGGEKIRLCFARIFVNPPNFLVLDEPTTHLDIAAREALQDAVKNYDGTVCLVSHDIEFVRKAVSTIIAMEPPGIARYCGDYDYYREKQAEKANSEGIGTADNKAEQSSSAQKERRRDRATRRGELGKIKKDAEKKVSRIEKAIEKLEEEKVSLSEILIANQPGTDYAFVNKRLRETEDDVKRLTEEWEIAALEFEEIQNEYALIHT
ncbi:MAG: hypothetical protein A2020_04730 [Lentisphaerae bacterium GWF2_45_14]|nr:MAG: hypothetical protein A2020_04730 [Lentisphaerae bacterium GWF2_45_14]